MSYEQCTYLLDTAVDSLQTSSSDTNQLSLLSGMDMPAKSSESAQQTDGFQACECGKGTLACSIHPSTPEAWTAFMRDSLAKTLALLESRVVLAKEPDQGFTAKSCASLAWYDQSSCSWRTYQQSFLTDSEPYSETWPRWGMTAGGSAYAHPMSERRITETGGFYWQTPVADDSVDRAKGKLNSRGEPKLSAQAFYPTPVSIDSGTGRFNTSVGSSNQRPTLAMMARRNIWPTATATAYNGWSPGHNRAATDDRLDYSVERAAFTIGQKTPPMRLNPYWVEWLMGFPIGFTVSKDWVTPSARCKPQQPTACLEATE